LKKWVEKLAEQFDFEWGSEQQGAQANGSSLNEERATLLYLIDIFNKHLIDFDGHPVRRTRETLDAFAKELLHPQPKDLEKTLFKIRQFFASYRVDEYTYFQKTFEDCRTIIWEFVDQLSEELGQERADDEDMRNHLESLKDAVESHSIDALKKQSRKFIDCYVEKQSKKDKRRGQRMKSIRKNLNVVKKQLSDASTSLRTDHLTQIFNRKTFDEYAQQNLRLSEASGQPISMLLIDIDHFKKVNDTYGHPIGDFVLKELAALLKNFFKREADLVARLGGEEFAILLPDYQTDHAMVKAEELLQTIRNQAYVHEGHELRFTVSIGVAQWTRGEDVSQWYKRADLALYNSKNTGRNRATLAPTALKAA
jgi:diguanylate cyclase